MYRIIVGGEFDSAHQLHGHDGKCRNLHGHTWKVKFWFLANDELCPDVVTKDYTIVYIPVYLCEGYSYYSGQPCQCVFSSCLREDLVAKGRGGNNTAD